MFQKTILVSALTLIFLSGCSDNGTVVSPGNDSEDPNNPDVELRALQQLETSDAFFSALREGLVRQNANSGFDEGRESIDFFVPQNEGATTGFSTGGETGGDTTGGSDLVSGSFDSDLGSAADVAQETAPNAAPSDVTTTNVQEVGVDEQDRMKSDGEYLYVIDNQYDNYFIEPAIDIDIEVDPISNPPQLVLPDDNEPGIDIDILPINTDVAGSSSFYEPQRVSSKLRILKLENEAPDATLVAEVDIGLNGGVADGMYLYKKDSNRSLIMTSSSFNSYRDSWYNPYAFSNAVSIVGKLDVTDPAQTHLDSALKIDGQIVSSRRIGDNLFLATRYFPAIANIDPYSMSAEEYRLAIENADLTTALPKITDVNDSVITELVNPGECFVSSDANRADPYYSPDIVTLSVIDLNTMTLKDSECFLGATETLYATPNSVYLATTQWGYADYPILELSDAVSTTSYVDPRVTTDIHQFSIDGSELTYSGSGVVDGHLGWNPDRMPFRMSEQGDYLRVATFADTQDGSVSPINVSVLNVAGTGALTTAAKLPNANRPEHIGKPGEQLYASRFLGNKGYLVTFRQTDPLYVVDFSNPDDPKLAGELEIEGYSDYLQPIGEDYLLGIGKDAVAAPNSEFDRFNGALVQGVKLSLFDVSDASNPIEVQSMVIGERNTYSDALTNHRAITVQAANENHPTRVAFGINVYGLADPRPIDDPFDGYPWNFTGLHGFDIKTGADAGIEKRGVMVVNSASRPQPDILRYGSDDRSVLVGDSVYYIYGPSVYAANWNDLSNFVGPR